MSLVSDFATKLISLGYGTALGTDIFAYQLPGKPYNAYLLIPMGGKEPLYYSDSSNNPGKIDRPGLQIQVRNQSKLTAETNAEGIRTALDMCTLSGYLIIQSTRSAPVDLTDPTEIEAGLSRFSVDFAITKNR